MSKKSLQLFLTFFFVIVFAVIFVDGYFRARTTSIQSSVVPISGGHTNASSQSSGTVPSPNPVASDTPRPQASTKQTPRPSSAPVTMTGTAYQIPWGPVQVSITVQGGKLTQVDTPQYPDSFPSQDARAYLISQALSAGSANIQGVSGATYVSIAFQKSLESALAKAGM